MRFIAELLSWVLCKEPNLIQKHVTYHNLKYTCISSDRALHPRFNPQYNKIKLYYIYVHIIHICTYIYILHTNVCIVLVSHIKADFPKKSFVGGSLQL
jgi:hypothetical protein